MFYLKSGDTCYYSGYGSSEMKKAVVVETHEPSHESRPNSYTIKLDVTDEVIPRVRPYRLFIKKQPKAATGDRVVFYETKRDNYPVYIDSDHSDYIRREGVVVRSPSQTSPYLSLQRHYYYTIDVGLVDYRRVVESKLFVLQRPITTPHLPDIQKEDSL